MESTSENRTVENELSRLASSSKHNTEDSDKVSLQIRLHHLTELKENLNLKIDVKKKVFLILNFEIIFLLLLVCFQGFGWFGFKLNDYVFGVLNTGALVHTFAMAKIVVGSLFPIDKKAL